MLQHLVNTCLYDMTWPVLTGYSISVHKEILYVKSTKFDC